MGSQGTAVTDVLSELLQPTDPYLPLGLALTTTFMDIELPPNPIIPTDPYGPVGDLVTTFVSEIYQPGDPYQPLGVALHDYLFTSGIGIGDT